MKATDGFCMEEMKRMNGKGWPKVEALCTQMTPESILSKCRQVVHRSLICRQRISVSYLWLTEKNVNVFSFDIFLPMAIIFTIKTILIYGTLISCYWHLGIALTTYSL